MKATLEVKLDLRPPHANLAVPINHMQLADLTTAISKLLTDAGNIFEDQALGAGRHLVVEETITYGDTLAFSVRLNDPDDEPF